MTKISSPQPNQSQIVKAKHIQIELPSQPLKYYRHGWQSWSLAAWTDVKPMPIQKPTIFHRLQIDVEYTFEMNPHGSWLGAVEFENGKILLLGHCLLIPMSFKYKTTWKARVKQLKPSGSSCTGMKDRYLMNTSNN